MLIFFPLRKSPVEKFWPFIYIKKLFKVCIYIYICSGKIEHISISIFQFKFFKSILQDDATQNNSPICTSTPIMASSLSLFFLIVIISNQFQCSEIFTRSFLFFKHLFFYQMKSPLVGYQFHVVHEPVVVLEPVDPSSPQ